MLVVDGTTYRYPDSRPQGSDNILLYVKRRVLKFFTKWELVEWDAKEQKFRQFDDTIVTWCNVTMNTINTIL